MALAVSKKFVGIRAVDAGLVYVKPKDNAV
jgi:hypothetical protein